MAVTQVYTRTNWKRRFFTIWTGQAFSLVGSSLVQFALVWWLTRTTGSAAVLASATVAALLPDIFLGPFVGALVDRWNRRWVMVIADSGIAVATLCLVILFWTGLIQPWHIYVAMLIRSLGNAFHWPAMQATTALMVPDEHLARIGGLNQAIRGLTMIISPPLGALLMELLAIHEVLAIDIGTAMMAVFPLLIIAVPQPARLDEVTVVTPSVLWRDVKFGFRYLIRWPGLFAIFILAIALNCLMNPAFNLMPLMVTNHFKEGAWLLGALEAANGVGVLLGGLTLGVWGGIKNRIILALSAMLVMSSLMIVLGFTPGSLPMLAIGLMFGMGCMNTIENATFFAAAQAKIPPQVQGRIFSLIQSGASGLVPLSMAVSAFLVEKLGIMFFFKFGGVVGVLGVIISFMIPAIRNFEKDPVPSLLPGEETNSCSGKMEQEVLAGQG